MMPKLALGRLVAIGDAGEGDRLPAASSVGRESSQQLGGVILDEDLGFEIEAGAEAQVFVRGAGVAIAAAVRSSRGRDSRCSGSRRRGCRFRRQSIATRRADIRWAAGLAGPGTRRLRRRAPGRPRAGRADKDSRVGRRRPPFDRPRHGKTVLYVTNDTSGVFGVNFNRRRETTPTGLFARQVYSIHNFSIWSRRSCRGKFDRNHSKSAGDSSEFCRFRKMFL